MKAGSPEPRHDAALLSAALKAVRRRRGLTAAEVAVRMHMARRTYERFEAGDVRPNLDHLHRFAGATDSDPHALLLALAVGSPELAARSADNKLATILTIAVQRLDRALGDRLSDLDARTLIAALAPAFDRLATEAALPDTERRWLSEGEAALSAARPRPGR